MGLWVAMSTRFGGSHAVQLESWAFGGSLAVQLES